MRDNRLRNAQLHRSIKEAETDLFSCEFEDLIKPIHQKDDSDPSIKAEWADRYQRYQRLYNKYYETNMIEDIQLIEKADIIGITTTGAAKNFRLLKMLVNCKIALIEEAGQVLESHVVTALPPKCKQLILIGDHQQLRPTISTYHMGKHYGLDVSLFERLIKNNFPYTRLEEQHRMRPEIAKIMSKVFYNGLRNHPSVTQYPKQINGLEKPVFFLTHNYLEESASADEFSSKSKVNLHEASLLLHIARYILANGYRKYQITILTTYLGQLFALKKLQREKFGDLEGISIAVVDNFQGEENDIILLSLVRSNHEGLIGFLSVQSRICVALSRARIGLYIAGNMYELASASNVWKSIESVLIESGMISNSLQLVCKVHNKATKTIKLPEDFEKLKNRGCEELCNEVLRCGHICLLACHVEDRLHSGEVGCCRMKCQKTCSEGHLCQKKCYENCYPCQVVGEQITLGCGHIIQVPCASILNNSTRQESYVCTEYITMVLACGHQAKVACADASSSRSVIICDQTCDYILPCGHPCNLSCHSQQNQSLVDVKSHNKKCLFPCNKRKLKCQRNHICDKLCYQNPCDMCTVIIPETTLPYCTHLYSNLKCHQDPIDVICNEVCGKSLPNCEHFCESTCGKCRPNSLSTENLGSICPPCKQKVEKLLNCGKHASIIEVSKVYI